MASGKELKAVITIAGALDPSLAKSIEQATKQTSGIGTALKVAGAVGGAAIAAAGAAVVKFGADSVEVGKVFDSSMSQVAATMGTTVDQIGDLRAYAMEMGSTTAFSATEAADAMNILAMAGYSAEENMATLPAVLDMAAAGGLGIAEAADYATGIIAGFSNETLDASTVADTLAVVASNAKGDVASFGEGLSTVAGMANTTGQSMHDMSVALGILGNNNYSASEAGNALSRTLKNLYQPTSQAEKSMSELGIAAYDAQGNARPLQDVLIDLNKSLDGMSDAEKNNALSSIFDSATLKSVPALLNNATDAWNDLSDVIDQSEGAAKRMAAVQLDNLEGDMTLFKSALEGAQIAMSDALTPALRELVQFGSDGLGTLATDVIPKVGEAMSKIMPFVQNVLDYVMNMIPAIVDGAKGIFNNVVPMVADAVSEIINFIIGINTALDPIRQAIIEAIIPAISSILTALSPVIDAVKDILPYVTEAVGAIVNVVLPPLQAAIELIVDIIQAIMPVITDICVFIIDQLGNVIQFVTDIISGDWTAAWGDMQAIFQTAWEGLPSIMEGVINAIASIGEGLVNFVVTMWDNVKQAFLNAFSALDELANGALSFTAAIIVAIFDKLWKDLTAVFARIKEAIVNSALGQAIQDIVTSMQEVFTLLMGYLESTFMPHWTNMWNKVKEVFQGIWTGLSGVVKTAFNAVIAIINKVIQAINSLSIQVPEWSPWHAGETLGFHLDEIAMLAKGGFTNGVSIAGEAGQEAVISFDSAVRKQNLSYWARAGKMLGVNAKAVDTLAASTASGKQGGNYITFSPNVTIQGNADYDSVLQALRDNEEEFMDMMEEFFSDRRLAAYG